MCCWLEGAAGCKRKISPFLLFFPLKSFQLSSLFYRKYVNEDEHLFNQICVRLSINFSRTVLFPIQFYNMLSRFSFPCSDSSHWGGGGGEGRIADAENSQKLPFFFVYSTLNPNHINCVCSVFLGFRWTAILCSSHISASVIWGSFKWYKQQRIERPCTNW